MSNATPSATGRLTIVSLTTLVLLCAAARVPAQTTPEALYETLKKTYPQNSPHDPAEEQAAFQVHPDFEVNLFASSPWVVNPVATAWDPQGRLWVINSPMYPHVLPGQELTDFISVLEDTDDDGRADKCTIFYDKLYVPTGLELGDGGAYVANQPDLLFLKDEDGDLRADTRRVLLSGFGTEDSHHAISAFVWGPGGDLYFESGIFLHTQVETPHGLVRLDNGGVFEFRPRTLKLGLFNVGTATNPWGHAFDQWGQSFLTEGPQGDIWYLTPGTVSSHPDERVPGTKAPKSCGNRFIYSSHFSEQYQGMMVLNAFKNKTVNLYRVSDDGAGYATREVEPLLIVSSEPYFRPVDVQLGPDGAIYIADFFQEIIGHMQFEFRDPRRDHLNGRIWRITQKGRKPLKKPQLAGRPADELAENLKSPDAFIREKSHRVLYDTDPKAVTAALERYVGRLDVNHPDYDRHCLEALWTYQTLDVVEPKLLHAVLASKDPRARAAAVRVLRYWLNEIPDRIELLTRAVQDSYPRVRLEAICALSYIPEARSMEIASLAANYPMDRFLDYSFKHTAIALKDKWLPALKAGEITFGGDANRVQAVLSAVNANDAVGILLAMLEKGEIPPARIEPVLAMVAGLGTPDELKQVVSRDAMTSLLAAAKRGYDADLHAHVLDALADAALEKPSKPALSVAEIKQLVGDAHRPLQTAAVKLAGAWRMEELRPEITRQALDAGASLSVRRTAQDALARLGGPQSAQSLSTLCGADQPLPLRYSAVAALAQVDTAAAAKRAAEVLAVAAHEAEPGIVLDAFLSRKGGDRLLLDALKTTRPDGDTAKLALRHLNATGVQPPELIAVLREIVGTGSMTAQLSREKLDQLMQEVRTKGDPRRGEAVFRRADLACMSCHSIAGSGAPVAPDLEGLGASSPLDYLVYSVLDPNKAVREGFAAVSVVTDEGRVYTGILKSKTPDELVILDATTRKLRRIPATSIEETAPAPSIMPKGLVDQMTRGEFIDLVSFINELGRPGPFATHNVPVFRTWRTLTQVPADWESQSPETIGKALIGSDALVWKPAYAHVSGELELADMASSKTAFVGARIDVGTGGKLVLRLNDPAGLTLWVDGKRVSVTKETIIDVTPGERSLTFRVNVAQRKGTGLRVDLDELPNSPARARVINGL